MSNRQSLTPFDNIESSHEYVSLLAKAVEEALAEVEADITLASESKADRTQGSFCNSCISILHKLSGHMTSSRRILNDLRTLRRLLLEERLMETALRRRA